MKSSYALKKARVLIEERKAIHLCIALKRVNPSRRTKVEQNIACTFGEHSVIGWLCATYPHFYMDFTETYGKDSHIVYRLAWIDWMIPQYEAIGD